MSPNPYTWQLPIGDWSGDGHSECEYFTIKSAHTLQACRERYFQLPDWVKLEEWASEYIKNTMLIADLAPEFRKSVTNLDKYGEIEGERLIVYPEGFAELFVDIMNFCFPELELEIVPTTMFPFFGYDDQTRHISFMGYGCFVDY